jgi:hypothetical protein
MPRGNWAIASAAVGLSLLLGLGVAAGMSPGRDEGAQGGYTTTTTPEGETITGKVETMTVEGEAQRVVRWRTEAGETIARTLPGLTTSSTVFGPGDTVVLPGGATTVLGPGETLTTTTPGQTVTTPGQTVTGPGQTVTQIVTETQHHTVTETGPTQTIVETVTVPGPTETTVVTETVTVVETVVP